MSGQGAVLHGLHGDRDMTGVGLMCDGMTDIGRHEDVSRIGK